MPPRNLRATTKVRCIPPPRSISNAAIGSNRSQRWISNRGVTCNPSRRWISNRGVTCNPSRRWIFNRGVTCNPRDAQPARRAHRGTSRIRGSARQAPPERGPRAAPGFARHPRDRCAAMGSPDIHAIRVRRLTLDSQHGIARLRRAPNDAAGHRTATSAHTGNRESARRADHPLVRVQGERTAPIAPMSANPGGTRGRRSGGACRADPRIRDVPRWVRRAGCASRGP